MVVALVKHGAPIDVDVEVKANAIDAAELFAIKHFLTQALEEQRKKEPQLDYDQMFRE